MKVLITGANGLLGQKLVQLLSSENIELLATSQGASRLKTPDAAYLTMDIMNRDEVMRVIGEYQPTVIFNTAAMTQVDQCETDRRKCWDINVLAVAHLIEASENSGAHLVHLSSDFIFDGKSGPYREEDQPNPINFYGQSKLAAEKLLYQSKIKWSIVRTILVYGATPGASRSNIMLWVKRNLEADKPIQVVDDQFRTPTLVEDLALGCHKVAERSAEGIYHISGADLLTPYDIAIITADFFKLDKSLIARTNSDRFRQPAKRPMKTGFIIDKAVSDLDYRPHSFLEGLAITAEHWE